MLRGLLFKVNYRSENTKIIQSNQNGHEPHFQEQFQVTIGQGVGTKYWIKD